MSNKYNGMASEAILKQALLECDEEDMASIPTQAELKKLYTPSELLDRKIRKQIRKAERMDFLRASVKITRRVAVVVSVITALAFSSLLMNQEVRAVIRNTIVEWFSGFTRFTFPDDTSDVQIGEWTVAYIPKGYELFEVQEVGAFRIVDFKHISLPEDMSYISLVYAPAGDIVLGVDNENAVYDMEYNQGIEYYILKAESEEFPSKVISKVIWVQDGVSFELSGYCPWAELIKMAQSTKK